MRNALVLTDPANFRVVGDSEGVAEADTSVALLFPATAQAPRPQPSAQVNARQTWKRVALIAGLCAALGIAGYISFRAVVMPDTVSPGLTRLSPFDFIPTSYHFRYPPVDLQAKLALAVGSTKGSDAVRKPNFIVLMLAFAVTLCSWLFCFGDLAGGDLVVTRFIAAPLPRAHEVIADAMQATGVFLFRNTETLVEGERTPERVYALRLPHGDEAIRAELASLVQDGKAGTQVRVETLRRSNKKAKPEHPWSAAVLDQAACLLSLLSLDDPVSRPKEPLRDGPVVRVADSTPLLVRSRHFLFNTDLRTNQTVPFETAEDTVVNGSIVIPAGSLATASVEQSQDIGEFHGASGHLRFRYVVLPDGTRLPLRGTADFQVKVGLFHGRAVGFAIPAGTVFQAQIDREQEVRISQATPPPSPK